jgi:molecular chaperone GrpE
MKSDVKPDRTVPESNSRAGHFMVAAGAVIEHSGSGKVLLLKRDKVDHNPGIWELGYGRIEQGEDLETGLRREIHEETGLEVELVEPLVTWHFYRGQPNIPENEIIGITYWARTDSRDVRLSSEHSEFQWLEAEVALETLTEAEMRRHLLEFMDRRAAANAAQDIREKYQRALADYQNLVRRSQEEKAEFAKFASRDLIEDLLQPLDHLALAAEKIDDQGVKMVAEEFARVLEGHGLQEIPVIGKTFDVETMEAVEKEGKGDKVIRVVTRGYALNGKVIRHAKVVLGEK